MKGKKTRENTLEVLRRAGMTYDEDRVVKALAAIEPMDHVKIIYVIGDDILSTRGRARINSDGCVEVAGIYVGDQQAQVPTLNIIDIKHVSSHPLSTSERALMNRRREDVSARNDPFFTEGEWWVWQETNDEGKAGWYPVNVNSGSLPRFSIYDFPFNELRWL